MFAQVIANREYRCLDQSDISGLVIDCGANIGLSTLYFLRRFPDAHVIALEPDPDNFKMLALNTAAFSDRVTLLQAAVWNKNTRLVFSDARALDRQEWAKTCREAEEREVPQIQAFDIPTILGMSSFKRVGLLKIDIEAGELALFDESAKDWIDLVDAITIELHGADCENGLSHHRAGGRLHGFALRGVDRLSAQGALRGLTLVTLLPSLILPTTWRLITAMRCSLHQLGYVEAIECPAVQLLR